MTKKATIASLANEGLTSRQIEERTGFSFKFIQNTIWELKNPEKAADIKKRYRAHRPPEYRKRCNQRKSGYNKKWKKEHPLTAAKHKSKLEQDHQNATKPGASKHGQEWTLGDIEILKEFGVQERVRDLALRLERSYRAVQQAGHRFGVDLRGDKMGANAIRFRKKLEPISAIH